MLWYNMKDSHTKKIKRAETSFNSHNPFYPGIPWRYQSLLLWPCESRYPWAAFPVWEDRSYNYRFPDMGDTPKLCLLEPCGCLPHTCSGDRGHKTGHEPLGSFCYGRLFWCLLSSVCTDDMSFHLPGHTPCLWISPPIGFDVYQRQACRLIQLVLLPLHSAFSCD